LFSLHNIDHDLLHSANVSQIARRRFRDIARIAGLIFQGFPSKLKKVRHLQASSELFFEVFKEYDAHNLLLKQSIDETMAFQLDDARIRSALHRIGEQEIVIKEITRPSPFCVPIMVDRLREKVGTERLESLIRRLVG
jgi:ATP-dependent Lhr-like helicase